MAITKLLTLEQWLEEGYENPKETDFKTWNRTAKELKQNRVNMICEVLDVSVPTISNICKGDFKPKEHYWESIAELAGQPILFNHKKEFYIVTP
jgi:hypothetical protein